ncbi:ATP-binding cassette domain-containing protein, partial [Bacillus sp. SIMBA_161]
MINCVDVGKKYGNTWSLHPIREEINPGRIVALCGSNGAGKSTLLNLMNGTI